MGRRLLLMMGIVLLASSAIPFAGSDRWWRPTASDAAPPGPPATHVALPDDLLPENPADAGAKPKAAPKAEPKKPGRTDGQEIGRDGQGQGQGFVV